MSATKCLKNELLLGTGISIGGGTNRLETHALFFVDMLPIGVILMMHALQVYWGKIEMIDAERRLLANALMDPNNQYFALVSESYVLRP